jgi:hypothetical protein
VDVSPNELSPAPASNGNATPQPAEDDLDREIEYAFDTDEPMLGRPPAGDLE